MGSAMIGRTFSASLLSLALLAFAPAAWAAAPAPSKPVELSSYSGRWFEIARMPNKLQRGCMAPSVEYAIRSNRLEAVQRCAAHGDGRARVYRSTGRILDPGTNAKTRLTFAGFWSQEYWIIDHAPGWAIVGDPSGRYLWLMSRSATLPQTTLKTALTRIAALGYDAGRLEFSGLRQTG
jgi:apolipoprotein D and lipocalin family protein